jgi:hypothetical protein
MYIIFVLPKFLKHTASKRFDLMLLIGWSDFLSVLVAYRLLDQICTLIRESLTITTP